jgi:hypothetical protein
LKCFARVLFCLLIFYTKNGTIFYKPIKNPRECQIKSFVHPFFACPKKRCPQERAPSNSAFGFPHKKHVHGGGTNSHIRALRQRAAGTRAHAFCLASLQWGLKSESGHENRFFFRPPDPAFGFLVYAFMF